MRTDERTYDRETYLGAKASWDEGEFGPEWAAARRLSWDRGFPFAPSGTRWDDREAENPSVRAIVYAALEDRPKDTLEIIGRSHSWGQVVSAIVQTEGRLREDIELAEREAAYEREERTTYREAVQSLASILGRIESSR